MTDVTALRSTQRPGRRIRAGSSGDVNYIGVVSSVSVPGLLLWMDCVYGVRYWDVDNSSRVLVGGSGVVGWSVPVSWSARCWPGNLPRALHTRTRAPESPYLLIAQPRPHCGAISHERRYGRPRQRGPPVRASMSHEAATSQCRYPPTREVYRVPPAGWWIAVPRARSEIPEGKQIPEANRARV